MEILNQSEVYANNDLSILLFAVVAVATMMLVIVTLLSVNDRDFKAAGQLFILTVIALFASWWLGSYTFATETHYEVLVTDLNEVYEQGYEIVENRGKITVIREVTE